MKNSLIFNLNNFNCECLSLVNDGTNSIEIQAVKENFAAPKIHFTLADGTTAETDVLTATAKTIKYEIPAAYYTLSGAISFYIMDGSYNSQAITLTGAANENNYSLTVTMQSDTAFSCSIKEPAASGGEFSSEWKEKINANTSARHGHINKTILDNLEQPLTNMEIEALLLEEE